MSNDPLAEFDVEILNFLAASGIEPETVTLSTPSERDFGERSTNIAFRLAKERRRPPQQIASELAAAFRRDQAEFISRVEPAGSGFLNFHLDYEVFTPHAINSIRASGARFGSRPGVVARRVVVEHTSVNPNKEWHIGHVRNAVLGDVVGRVLRLAGDDVEIQNYIDDTGLQAAQAVVGILNFPATPLPGEKHDHYVGRLYVKVAAELAAEPELRERLEELERSEDAPIAESVGFDERDMVRARLLNIDHLKHLVMAAMHALETGEHHRMTERILDGQLQTAYRLGIFYDLLNWESHLIESGIFREAITLLEMSPSVKRPTTGRYHGALIIETGRVATDDEPKAEVLIRSSGLPTYVAKDIAYHMWKLHAVPDRLSYSRYSEQPNGVPLLSTALKGEHRQASSPDLAINVIAVNQTLAQQAVKQGLSAGGFPDAAERLMHLAYGLVSTAEGRISGRKGTNVSGDAVIEQAVAVAYERVREKRSQELSDEDMRSIAESVGIGALRYFMVQYNPMRDIVFDVADVVSYDGNTGLYVQYALVRMFAILRRAQVEHGLKESALDRANLNLLSHKQERRLLFHLVQYPALVADVARTLAVNLVSEYAYELATIFSHFYRDCSVLNADRADVRDARLQLVRTVRDVLANACHVLGVPVIERL